MAHTGCLSVLCHASVGPPEVFLIKCWKKVQRKNSVSYEKNQQQMAHTFPGAFSPGLPEVHQVCACIRWPSRRPSVFWHAFGGSWYNFKKGAEEKVMLVMEKSGGDTWRKKWCICSIVHSIASLSASLLVSEKKQWQPGQNSRAYWYVPCTSKQSKHK